ncbi:hypothetical protein PFISCL1PPCAC_1311, partial [Pristionchus fissidentatus]
VNIDKRVHAKHRDHARKYVDDLTNVLSDVERAARHLAPAAQTMVEDLFSSSKRNEAIRPAQEVISAIMRFFLICDQLDVYFIIENIDLANSLLHDLRNAKTIEEVEERYSMLLSVLEEIDESTRVRLAEIRSSKERDTVMAAHALVKSSVPLVHSTTKAVVSHPEFAQYRDAAHSDMHKALEEMRAALAGQSIEGGFGSSSYLDGYGNLAAELQHFQNRFMMDPSQYRGNRDRADLEEILERIVTQSAKIADEPSTRHDRKHKIIGECNHLRQALQELLKEYESNRGRAETSEDMDMAMVLVERRMKDLKRHLRRAIIDNVGDAFLDQKTPLLVLIDAASRGLHPETEHAAYGPGGFEEHARRLVEVAKLSTEMSTDREGIRHVKYASEQVKRLVPQVVQAAFLLCSNPSSQMAIDHMEVMRKMWESKVHALTLGVGALISLDDFLAVTEAHIVEDAMSAVNAIAEGQVAQLDSCAGAIRGRCLRVYDMVDEELECLEIGGMTAETVKQANKILREEVRRFETQSTSLLDKLENAENMSQQERSADATEFSNSCTLVLTAVKNIRNALLVNRNPDDVDSDNEYEDDGVTHADQRSTVSDADNQQRLMRKLPEEDKKKIQEQIEVFNLHQKKFEQEVAMWDDNDIIILAKRMCAILGDMMDFTRGRGKLKSTMDVIRAAQEISMAGQKLSVLARQIGDVAEESNSRNEQLRKTKADLVSYLDKMVLFCQQLNICSRVKADVTQVGDELVVSGLDSALSLTQAARNLLTAVVSAVKNSYILSTKFPANSGAPGVTWKMTAPRKQPLVASTTPARNGGGGSNRVVRRASERRPMP